MSATTVSESFYDGFAVAPVKSGAWQLESTVLVLAFDLVLAWLGVLLFIYIRHSAVKPASSDTSFYSTVLEAVNKRVGAVADFAAGTWTAARQSLDFGGENIQVSLGETKKAEDALREARRDAAEGKARAAAAGDAAAMMAAGGGDSGTSGDEVMVEMVPVVELLAGEGGEDDNSQEEEVAVVLGEAREQSSDAPMHEVELEIETDLRQSSSGDMADLGVGLKPAKFREGCGNRWRNFKRRVFNRHGAEKVQEPTSWLGWIPHLILLSNKDVLEAGGRDSYLYLRFQRTLLFVTVIMTATVFPLLLLVNLYFGTDENGGLTSTVITSNGTAIIYTGFELTTTNHIDAHSPLLWVHTACVVFVTVLICSAMYFTIKAVRMHIDVGELVSSARLFTAKISGIPTRVVEESLLKEFVDIHFPGQALQVYLCLRMPTLQKLYKQLRKVEARILHYEVLWSTTGVRSQIRPDLPFGGLPNCFAGQIDALEYLYGQQHQLEAKIETVTAKVQKNKRSTGVGFVTFRSATACADFIERFANAEGRVGFGQFGSRLELYNWRVVQAPEHEDIRWKSLHVGIFEYAVRVLAVNFMLFIALFFFTTPIAMLSGIREYSSDIVDLHGFISWVQSSTYVGSILVAYLPSLLLMLLTFVLPHILFLTTKLEGYHTRNGENRVGMYKVYLYQMVAILVLPFMALTSLRSLLAISLDALTALWEKGAMFPNGVVFVQYVIQSALLANTGDLWRGPDILLEMFFKAKARTQKDLEDAEDVPPFKFGYKYQYFLTVFTISLFYSTVVPLIIPAGCVYMAYKHFVDKYNLVYHFPKAPASSNRLTQHAAMLSLISLSLYQLAMAVYLNFYKKVPTMAAIVLVCAVLSAAFALYVNLVMFKRVKGEIHQHDDLESVDPESFRDLYLHPCIREHRRRHG